jgi:hypothetical protein
MAVEFSECHEQWVAYRLRKVGETSERLCGEHTLELSIVSSTNLGRMVEDFDCGVQAATDVPRNAFVDIRGPAIVLR